MVPGEGEIRVLVRDLYDPGRETVLGAFTPSQINALLGLARNSTLSWEDEVVMGRFDSWQFREDQHGEVWVDLIFEDI